VLIVSEMARRDYDLRHNLAETFCNTEKSDFSPEMAEQANRATWVMASSSRRHDPGTDRLFNSIDDIDSVDTHFHDGKCYACFARAVCQSAGKR
jgi:hypothetical protein